MLKERDEQLTQKQIIELIKQNSECFRRLPSKVKTHIKRLLTEKRITEVSCGLIVLRLIVIRNARKAKKESHKSRALSTHPDYRLDVLIIGYPTTQYSMYYEFPKGHYDPITDHGSCITTAIRETVEETNISPACLKSAIPLANRFGCLVYTVKLSNTDSNSRSKSSASTPTYYKLIIEYPVLLVFFVNSYKDADRISDTTCRVQPTSEAKIVKFVSIEDAVEKYIRNYFMRRYLLYLMKHIDEIVSIGVKSARKAD